MFPVGLIRRSFTIWAEAFQNLRGHVLSTPLLLLESQKSWRQKADQTAAFLGTDVAITSALTISHSPCDFPTLSASLSCFGFGNASAEDKVFLITSGVVKHQHKRNISADYVPSKYQERKGFWSREHFFPSSLFYMFHKITLQIRADSSKFFLKVLT